jgi:hypothetical protein
MRRELRQAFGLFFALLALMAQLAVAAAVPATAISLADATTLCRHDGHSGAPPAPIQTPACRLCLLCHGASVAFDLLTAPPALPQPTTIRFMNATVLRSAAAPPPRCDTAARPRAPPIPV